MNIPDISFPSSATIHDFLSANADFVVKGISTIAVLVAAFVIYKVLTSSLARYGAEEVKTHYQKAVSRIFQIIISIAALFIVLGIWGVSMTGLLAGAGFMGIVVGLAAQETLGNVISGLLMMFSRPFEIGDWVKVSDYSGIVEDITVINTKIKTFDGEIVSIPNKKVSSAPINNLSGNDRLRVKKTIGIDYESDPEKAREIVKEELEGHDLVMESESPKVMVDELSDSSVNLTLLFWIKNPTPRKKRKTINDIISSVKKRFEEEGIGIPFPHRELIQHESRGWKLNKE